ncbi:GTPase HflX [Dehalogenimonas alkenigignens]
MFFPVLIFWRNWIIVKKLFETVEKPEKTILVAVDTGSQAIQSGWTVQDSLNELEQLLTTAGGVSVGRLIQKLSQPNKSTYLGKGKLEELLSLQNTLQYSMAIFDDELTPAQQRTLEDFLKVKVIDRAALILDIFARHAKTMEGKLQVELAQYQYLLPRLAGQWSHLERLGGGIGTRGPGESQLESDKRLLQQRISKLKDNIDRVSRQRNLYRNTRRARGIPVIAIVGYTNSGKSSLLNALTKSNVQAENKLFATLDPTTRRIGLPDNRQFLLTDTVGFIKKLPPTIIKAFRATLEEIVDSTLLIHVIDINSPNAVEQCQTVEQILNDLGLGEKPRITVFNKIDLLPELKGRVNEPNRLSMLDDFLQFQPSNTVLTSATRRWGLKNLLETIGRYLPEPYRSEEGSVS